MPLPLGDHDLLPEVIRTIPPRPSTAFEQLEDGPKLPVPVKFAFRSKPVAFQDTSKFSYQICRSDRFENNLLIVPRF